MISVRGKFLRFRDLRSRVWDAGCGVWDLRSRV